jgi:hypothetical protein
MTIENPEPEGRTNTALIVLGLAAVLLVGSVVGFLIGGGQSSDTTVAPSSTTTLRPATTTTETTATTTAPTTTTTVPAPTELEFPASEDTTVDSSTPADVLGGGELLLIEQEEDDIIHTLVRFEVAELPADAVITAAVLRLTVLDESAVPGEVSRVGGPWTEAETTWETAPPIGAPISPLPGGTEGAVLDIDVTSVVTGPGIFDFYLTTSSSDGMDFASREAPAGGPALVLTLGDQGDSSEAEGTVLVGAGDIAACNSQGDEATAAVIDEVVSGAEQAVVFTAGDNAYPNGSERDFLDCYDPSWGAFKDITRPALGSREYHTGGARGHFDYFGVPPGERDKGYYSYDIAGWHVVVLNSNCDQIGGCEAGSAQEVWLRGDLAASNTMCTLAYWHHPLFSSGSDGGVPEVLPLFQALYDAEAELVINGDDHFYERFAPQDPAGEEEQDEGIRQFIVGTGGSSLSGFGAIAANSDVRFDGAFGVLALTLLPDGYEWAFMSVAGSDFNDPGTGTCH